MLSTRKEDHLRICLQENVRPKRITTGLERYRFVHQALPDIALDEVQLQTTFLGKALAAPLLISAMTGGTQAAQTVNRHLAEAAQAAGIALCVGSQRAALECPDVAQTYRIRDMAPDILLFANLGAVQLNLSYTVAHCQRAVDMIEADALVLHLNPLQEALQPEGDVRFDGLLSKIESVCKKLPVPVVVKEVGYGLSAEVARRLVEAGVGALDVAGAGGTLWGEVERYRITDPLRHQVAAQFIDWGIPTAESLCLVRGVDPTVPLIASGGVENGIQVAKCIALGANVAGMAWPLLQPALLSAQAVVDAIDVVVGALRVAMFCIGAPTVAALQNTPFLKEVIE